MTLVAGQGALLPATGDFWLRQSTATTITLNILKVTARATDVLTVVGGQDGTTDQDIAAGVDIEWTLSVSAFDQFRKDISQSGTLANLPATGGKTGDIYRPSDANLLFRKASDTDNDWAGYLGPRPITPPPLSSWDVDNASDSTVTYTNGVVCLVKPSSIADSFTRVVRAITVPYTITAGFVFNIFGPEFPVIGICLANSTAGDKFIEWGAIHYQNISRLHASYRNGNGSYAGEPTGLKYDGRPSVISQWTTPVWLRFANNGTTRTYQISHDGYHWLVRGTEAAGTFITETRAGIVANGSNENVTPGTGASQISLVSWLVE